jgi:cytochrome P450
MVVLNTDQAVKDLLDKRSNIYSSRPEMYLGNIVSGSLRVLLMEYGDTWRMIRKMVHNILNIKAARSYVPYQDLENKQMLMGFLEQPDLFIDHIRRYTNSLTTQMVFGFRTISIDDPKLIQLYEVTQKFWMHSLSRCANMTAGIREILRSYGHTDRGAPRPFPHHEEVAGLHVAFAEILQAAAREGKEALRWSLAEYQETN